jgi:ABC-type nitrate/sulfonate/bicarbonate transport system substrate-binding protein
MRIKPLGWLVILIIIGFVLYGAFSLFRPQIENLVGTVAEQVDQMSNPDTPNSSGQAPGNQSQPSNSTETGETLPTVTVGFDAFASYYNVILIDILDLDAKYGFELDLIPFCSTDENCFTEDERSEALSNGEWDIMLTTLDKLALNPNIGVLTALVDESDGADKVVVNPSIINTLNDLHGARISYMDGSIGEYFVYYLLNLVRIAPDEVELFPSEDVIAATDLYTNGWVDVVSGWEPDVDASVDSGGEVIIDSGRLRVVVDVILASNQAVDEQPELVQAFHNAWYEALKFQFENPEQAEQLVISWGMNDWTYVEAEGDLQGWLETIAQASLGANELAMRDPNLLAERLSEARTVWQWSGRVIPDVDLTTLVEPRFVIQAASNPNLQANTPPINDSFLMTGTPDLPSLSEEELGGATVLAVLPLRKISFEPDSTRLTEEAQAALLEQIIPVLRTSTELYLRIDGSSAWPGPQGTYTEEQIRNFAYRRALAVAQFLAGYGIDSDRLILGTIDPQFPFGSPEQLEQDRYVQFTLIEPTGR